MAAAAKERAKRTPSWRLAPRGDAERVTLARQVSHAAWQASRRRVHWLIALLGLAIPLIGSSFTLWPLVLVWLVALTVAWLFGRCLLPARSHRIAAAILFLPLLVLLGWESGWWLIPADLAWLVIELASPGIPTKSTISTR